MNKAIAIGMLGFARRQQARDRTEGPWNKRRSFVTSNRAWRTTRSVIRASMCSPRPHAATPRTKRSSNPAGGDGLPSADRRARFRAVAAPRSAAPAPATHRAVVLQPFPATDLIDFPRKLSGALPLPPAPLEYRLIEHDLVIRDAERRSSWLCCATRSAQSQRGIEKVRAMSGTDRMTGGRMNRAR